MSFIEALRQRIFGDISDEFDSRESYAVPNIEDEMTELTGNESCAMTGFAPRRVNLNVITVADSHGNLRRDDIMNPLHTGNLPDAVFLLGDNFVSDLETVLDIVPESIPIYGVVGNHDQKDLLADFPRIKNVNGICTAPKSIADDYTIAGLSGSIRYKSDDYYAMLTNEESEQAMSRIPYADILLAHDKPCFSTPERLTSHSGLTGIGKYILERKPKIVLHGHLHERYAKRLGGTVIRCCYGVEKFPIAF